MTTIPTLDVKSRPSPETDMRWVRWLGSMLDGSTSTGTITIKADRTSPLLDDDPDQPRSILPNPITSAVQEVNLVEDIGTRKYMYVAVPVPASDDPDLVGYGFTYTAEIKLKNGAQFGPYTFTVPLSTPATGLWLNKVAAATPAPGEALPQITKAEFDDAVARILVLESMGGAGGAPHSASHGPGGVDAVALSATQITTGVIAPARLGAGTADSSTVLFGDGSWKMVPGGSGSDPDAVKLSGDQTVSGVKSFTQAPSVPDGSWTFATTTGLQDALDGKAPTASPAFTGTVTGVTKAMVGLGNVDNTADTAKTINASQIISGVIPAARLGTGLAGASTVLYGDGTWKTAPTGGGGGTGEVPPGTPIVRFANPDMTWPTDLPTPTAAQPLILYADISSDPDMLAYPAPPLHTRNQWMRYHGPEPIEQMPTVTVASSNVNGRTATFTATPNPTPETTIIGFAWTFTQGGVSTGQTGTGQSVTKTAPNAGEYTATVVVTDSNGMTATASHTVTLTEGQVTVTARGTVDGMTVEWAGTGTDPEGEPITYSWTGTDGLTGTGATLSKTYATSGTKSATVTATDSKGTTATATATVSVSAPVTGAFTSDTFTTASTDVLNRDTEPMATNGGTAVKPLGVGQPARVSIASGRLKLDTGDTNNVNVTYPNSAMDPKVAVTIPMHSGDPLFRFTCYWNGTQSVYALFEAGGKITWGRFDGASTTTGVMQATGAWTTGDRVELSYVGTTFRVLVTRAGATHADLTTTITRPSAVASSRAGVRQDRVYQNIELDDLWIGSA